MNVLLDTNVILDLALRGEPFFAASAAIFAHPKSQRTFYLTPLACTDIYYIIHRERDRETAVAFLADLFDVCKLCGLDKTIMLQALESSFTDFEDAVQNFAAVAAGLDIIVTRSASDFKNSSLPLMSPAELIETIGNA